MDIIKRRYISLVVCVTYILGLFAAQVHSEDYQVWNGTEVDSALLGYMINKAYPYSMTDLQSYQAYANVRPRILIDAQKVQTIKTDSRYLLILGKFLNNAEKILYKKIPIWEETKEDTTSKHRPVGDYIAELATAYLLTGDERYYYGVSEGCYGVLPAILAACVEYECWGENTPAKNTRNVDLVCSHIMHGLGIAYDYCNGIMSPETKTLILETVAARGGEMYQKALTSSSFAQWTQNHPMINYTGMTVFALATFEDFAPAQDWLKQAFNYMNISFRMLGDDGANQEGVGYSQYAARFLMMYGNLAKKFFNTNLYTCSDYFKNYDEYLYYMKNFNVITGKNQNMLFANTGATDWYDISSMLYRIADEYDDGYAQGFANDMVNMAQVCNFQSVLYYNPDITPISMTEKPLTKHFDDQEIVVDRTSWDPDMPVFSAKCGPMPGHKAVAYNTGVAYCGGHCDPDANHFSVIGYDSEWLISDDAGWSYGISRTNHHNTLMINGTGQLGESGTAQFSRPNVYSLNNLNSKFSKVEATKDYGYYIGNAKETYDTSLGLTRFDRHFLYLKPDVLLIIDDVETSTAAELELRVLPANQDGTQYGGAYLFEGTNNKMRIENLTLQNVTQSLGKEELLIDTVGTTLSKEVVSYKYNGNSWKNITAISWSRNTSEPVAVSCSKSGSKYLFTADDVKCMLDLDSRTVTHSGKAELLTKVNGNYVESEEVIAGQQKAVFNYISDKNTTANLIFAHYKDNKLEEISIDTKTVSAYAPIELSADMVIDYADEHSTVKCFVWNAEQNPLNNTLVKSNIDNKAEIEKIVLPQLSDYQNVYELPAVQGYDTSVYQSHLNRFIFFYSDENDIKNIVPVITLSKDATMYPEAGTSFDFTKGDAVVTVISKDGGTSQEYRIKAVKWNTDGQYFTEDFSCETPGSKMEWGSHIGTEKDFALNSGTTLTFYNSGMAWMEIVSDDETQSNCLMLSAENDSVIHRLRFPKSSDSLVNGGTNKYILSRYRMKLERSESAVYSNFNGSRIQIGACTDVFIRDTRAVDEDGDEYVSLMAVNGIHMGNVKIGEWFDLEVLIRGMYDPIKTGNMEVYYYLNGKVVPEAINAIGGVARNSVVSANYYLAPFNAGRIYFDRIDVVGGKATGD